MEGEQSVGRRRMLAAGVGLLAGLPAAVAAIDPEEGVTAPEDLMKEHGVLNRCLLIYEEGLARLRDGGALWPGVFAHTARLIRSFVEDYHERNEERYLFPAFRRAGKLVDLVETLEAQHQAGRRLTQQILALAAPEAFRDAGRRDQLATACRAFVRMYRPHEAREDTVLFPALRTILTARQVLALGERMEADEQKVLGHEGFERSLAEVESIEKALGIFDLAQFTP
ncbi:MAG: hemerythrin domain-containing protein [Armatimonadetes bacterium]|nr:hemerythrin domain-containing protein [Armatimonadota bacterium]